MEFFFEQSVDALGEPHAPHAAVPEQRQHAIGAEQLAGKPPLDGGQGLQPAGA